MAYFTINLTRLKVRECIAMTRGVNGAILLIARLLQIPVGRGVLHRHAAPQVVSDMKLLPPDFRDKLGTAAFHVRRTGFNTALVLWSPKRLGPIASAEAYMTEHRAEIVARVRVSRNGAMWPPKWAQYVHFLTLFKDGTLLVTGDDASDMTFGVHCELVSLPRRPPSDLLEHHATRVEAYRTRSPIVPVSEKDVLEFCTGIEDRAFEHWQSQGVFEPTTPQALTEAEQLWKGVDCNDECADAIVAVRRLQTARTNWRTGLTLFAVSLAAFIATGALRWQASTLIALIAILFLHESGHFAAMKLFGYRNVRMFFLPMFGAAVSGESLLAPGWKRAAVAMAGPVPGILVGALIGIFAAWHGIESLKYGAFMMIVLNAVNLLPMLPLDGGHVFRAMLFSRNPRAEFVFRVVAGILMIALGQFAGGIFTGIGVLILLQCRTLFRIGQAVESLRAKNAGHDPEGVAVMSPGAIGEIVRELGPAISTGRSKIPAKTFAMYVRDAYTSLNAPPSGPLSIVVVLLVYAASLALAFILGMSIFWVDWARHPRKLAAIQHQAGPRHASVGATWRMPQPLTVREKDIAAKIKFPEEIVLRAKGWATRVSQFQTTDDAGTVQPAPALLMLTPGGSAPAIVRKFQTELTPSGFMVFRANRDVVLQAGILVVMRGDDPADIVRLMQTSDEDGRISNEQICRQVAAWHQAHGVTVRGASDRWLDLEIARPPADCIPLVREIIALCPDFCDQDDDSIGIAAAMIERTCKIEMSWETAQPEARESARP